MITIVIIAGEVSGDSFGADLIKSIQKKNNRIRFIGVGGEKMISVGLKSLLDINQLSIMGFDVVKNYFKLKKTRLEVIDKLVSYKPDLVIGIDSPDFTLKLEKLMKQKGFKVWHWVSPSVWAWRSGRISKIGESCDELLCLFPKEPDLYKNHSIKSNFYGHPMADSIPIKIDTNHVLNQLGKSYPNTLNWKNNKIIALLPGSRFGEVRTLTPLFFLVAQKLLEYDSSVRFVLPIAKESIKKCITEHHNNLLHSISDKILLVEQNARECIIISDYVLLASGTAALETMLLKKPMVVSYAGGWLHTIIFKLFFKTPYVSLPNYLLGKLKVKELLFKNATVDNIYNAMIDLLEIKDTSNYLEEYNQIHKNLAQNCIETIANKVLLQVSTKH